MRESLLSRHRKGMERSTKNLSTWRRSSASEWELRGWSLRENCLVPDIGKFLEGLWVCGAFLTSTREELKELGQKGKQGQQSMIYFKAGRETKQQLHDIHHMQLLSSSSAWPQSSPKESSQARQSRCQKHATKTTWTSGSRTSWLSWRKKTTGSIGMGETDKQTKPDIHPTQML